MNLKRFVTSFAIAVVIMIAAPLIFTVIGAGLYMLQQKPEVCLMTLWLVTFVVYRIQS